MSLLVANYGSSSEGEDSDSDNEAENSSSAPAKKQSPITALTATAATNHVASNSAPVRSPAHKTPDDAADSGGISDSDDEFGGGHISDEDEEAASSSSRRGLPSVTNLNASLDSDVIGLSGTSLNLPKPRHAPSTSSSSPSPPPVDSASSSMLNLGSVLPTPKEDAASGSGVDEELEEFLRPREWEIQAAEKVIFLRKFQD